MNLKNYQKIRELNILNKTFQIIELNFCESYMNLQWMVMDDIN